MLFAKWVNLVYEKLEYLPRCLSGELANGKIEKAFPRCGPSLGSFTVT